MNTYHEAMTLTELDEKLKADGLHVVVHRVSFDIDYRVHVVRNDITIEASATCPIEKDEEKIDVLALTKEVLDGQKKEA